MSVRIGEVADLLSFSAAHNCLRPVSKLLLITGKHSTEDYWVWLTRCSIDREILGRACCQMGYKSAENHGSCTEPHFGVRRYGAKYVLALGNSRMKLLPGGILRNSGVNGCKFAMA